MLTCEGCGLELDDYVGQVYQMVTGWAKSEGGRSVSTPWAMRDEQRFACSPCAHGFISEVVWPNDATTRQLVLFDPSSPPD